MDSELKSHRKEITKLRKGSASKASRESASESMMGSYIHFERPSSATKPKKIHSCTHAQSLVMSPTMLPKSSISPVRRAPFKSNEGKGYKSALMICEQQSGQKEDEARLTAKHERLNSTQKYAIESDEDNLHAVHSFVH